MRHHLKLGDTHPHTKESLNTLIALYEAWNKPKQAAQWRPKLPATIDYWLLAIDYFSVSSVLSVAEKDFSWLLVTSLV